MEYSNALEKIYMTKSNLSEAVHESQITSFLVISAPISSKSSFVFEIMDYPELDAALNTKSRSKDSGNHLETSNCCHIVSR
jgi:hypothetical protein